MSKSRTWRKTNKGKVVICPWGTYEVLDSWPGVQVKRLIISPHSALSLQKHNYRAEFWVVISGTATVVVDTNMMRLQERETVDIPVGTVHRLQNDTNETVEIIELQFGEYLGEDDIVRFEDRYGRV